MHLHSIYLSPADGDSQIPDRIERNILSFKLAHPTFRHKIYSMDTGRRFLSENFGTDVVYAFDSLIPLAYKADLLRYCLLYKYGGIYSDVSLSFFKSIDIKLLGKRLLVFRDGFSRVPWIVSNSPIAAEPQLAVFEECIKKICEHVHSSFFGENALCPTGPNLFGRKLAITTEISDFSCGKRLG